MDKVDGSMAQKVHDLVFVSAGTLGLDLTWFPSEGVMMMIQTSLVKVLLLHAV